MKNGLAIYAGGNHIFYIIGVLKYLFEKGLKFDAVATYSAGSAILPFLIDENFAEAPEIFARYLDSNARNFYPANFLNRQDVFPRTGFIRARSLKSLNSTRPPDTPSRCA